MIIFLWVKGFCMNKGFLALALFGISLFLLVSSVSAEDIGSDDSNANFEVSGEQSIETSDISSDSANSDSSSDVDEESNNNTDNNTNSDSAIDSSKVPSRFSSTKNISSIYGKKAKFSVKVLNNEG